MQAFTAPMTMVLSSTFSPRKSFSPRATNLFRSLGDLLAWGAERHREDRYRGDIPLRDLVEDPVVVEVVILLRQSIVGVELARQKAEVEAHGRPDKVPFIRGDPLPLQRADDQIGTDSKGPFRVFDEVGQDGLGVACELREQGQHGLPAGAGFANILLP